MGTLEVQVGDDLWAVAEPLLPPTRPAGTPGHPPVPNRVALAGIIFVLKTGIPGTLPAGSGLLWHDAVAPAAGLGASRRVGTAAPHVAGTTGGRREDRLRRASADGARVPAKRGAARRGRTRRIGASQGRTTTWWSTLACVPLARYRSRDTARVHSRVCRGIRFAAVRRLAAYRSRRTARAYRSQHRLRGTTRGTCANRSRYRSRRSPPERT